MNRHNKYTYFVSILFFGLAFISLTSCHHPEDFEVGKKVECDAETRWKNGVFYRFSNDTTTLFAGGRTQSSLQSRSGNFSALTIPKIAPFAMAYHINDVGPNVYFKVSVWRKSKDGEGALVAAAKDVDMLYQVTTDPVEVDSNGWERLEMDVFTSPIFTDQVVSFYVWNKGADTVYFDDLVIERLSKPSIPEYNESPLVIEMDSSAIIKIAKKRTNAFYNGVLQGSDNDWVKGFLFADNKIMKAKLRLKGDWLDHLWGQKWSYRIKMGKGQSWNRLRTFSIHTPEARNFLMEWKAHLLYTSQDVLTTRYGFIPVIMNGRSLGMYAWEEHFVKQILENRNRREGPIVKFSEDAFWQIQKIYIKNKVWKSLPYFEAASIEPFGEGKILENPGLYNQFLNAQKLLYQYKTHTMPASQVFDIDKLANYYAMLDLTRTLHGRTWHNQRFYYNPLLGKLEPIAYDGYTSSPTTDISIESNLANEVMSATYLLDEEYLYFDFFYDSVFLNKYLNQLSIISNEQYIDSVLSSISTEESFYDSLMRLEFPHYKYDTGFFRKSAMGIRNYLPELRQKVEAFMKINHGEPELKAVMYSDTSVYEDTPEYFVNAYIESYEGDSMFVGVHNYYPHEIKLMGTSIGNNFIMNYFDETPTLASYQNGMDGIVSLVKVDSTANYLFFMLNDNESVFKVPIHHWPYPSGLTPQQELYSKIDLVNNPYIEKVVGNQIYIKQDSLIIDQPFIIPEGYQVVFKKGTVMNLINKSMFISYSTVLMNGTAEHPIVVTSSDHSANGFTVLQASGLSHVEHTHFEGLNTLNYKGWTLTGAVTFFESNVNVIHSKFYLNQCEDALNIVRSGFMVNHVDFDSIYGDAFDSDFSTGQVLNTRFINIGNDAIDFSGSNIDIDQVDIINAKDKGISGGELSHLKVANTKILGCNIGIASKDLSVVEVVNTSVVNCIYGLVLLQKKPEYGPGTMTMNRSVIENAHVEMLIEEGSKVVFDGQELFGNEKRVADMFY